MPRTACYGPTLASQLDREETSQGKELHMRMFKFGELSKALVLAATILVFAGLANAQRSESLDDDDDKKSPTPPGLYITPTALANAVQQPLNPGLTNYPNFVAGQAVKAVVSPD